VLTLTENTEHYVTIIGKNMNQNKERRERDLKYNEMREGLAKQKKRTASEL